MAVGGTVIIYGGLTFYNTLIRGVNQEVVYDDSGTDALCFKFNITATVWIHGLDLARMGILPSTGDADAANNLSQVRYLFAPRQHFEYRMGVTFNPDGSSASPGALLLVADPANNIGSTDVSFTDVNNGPKARVISISRVAADALIRADVEFEIWQTQCQADGSCDNTSGVLNNRWSVVDEIDKNFITTRTFTGKLRCSSSQVNANNFRNLVVPPLQPGMRRDRMQFSVSEDALNLMYSVTDKEVAFAPPAPATTWSARFSERKEYDGQIGFYSTAEITLGGDRYVDKQKLFAIAASMAEAKFQNGVRLADDDTFFVLNISMIDEYTDDSSFVHLSATARRVDSSQAGILGLPSSFLGKPLDGKIEDVVAGYDSRFSRGSREGDVIEVNGPIDLVGAFAAYLQGPCQLDFGIALGTPAEQPEAPTGEATTTVSAVINNGIADDKSLADYGSSNNAGMYDFYEAETHDETESNDAVMPVSPTDPADSFSMGSNWYDNKPPDIPSVVTIPLAPPVTERETIIVGERVGSPPKVLTPNNYTDEDGVTWRVQNVKKSFGNPKLTADGKYKYRIHWAVRWVATICAPVFSPNGFFGLTPWNVTEQVPIDSPDHVDPK